MWRGGLKQTLAMMHTASDRFGPQPAALMFSYFLLERSLRKISFASAFVTLIASSCLQLCVSAAAVISHLSISK